MSEEIDEITKELVKLVSEDCKETAKQYCRDRIDSEVEAKSDEYEELKSEAIDETEVWGEEAKKWLKILPAAASEDETDSEWKFVTGNFLLSSVMECKTEGSVVDDALIAKAAHEMFEDLHKSDRHEMLSLALYHHKMGHVGLLEENYETSIENFENSLTIIDHHQSLGGWHHHALILRDLAKAECKYYEEQDELIEAVQSLGDKLESIKDTNAPTREKFSKQLKAEEHRIRAQMADQIDNRNRQRKHLRKCSRLYKESGKEDLAEKFNRMEMRING